MMRIRNLVAAAVCAAASTSCFGVDHFTGDAALYDGMYFGTARSAPREPATSDEKWRNYALFGLVPWDEAQTRFAGHRLAEGADGGAMRIVVHTEQSLVNGLTSFGLGLVGGILAPLLFVPRTTAVTGWSEF